jgi:ABC-type antimicrobial peptide transport system permease subunit
MALPGVALGLVVAVVLEHALKAWVLPAERIDVGVATTVALLMISVVLGAVVLPSLRAAAVRPVTMLRGELTTSPRWPRSNEATRP